MPRLVLLCENLVSSYISSRLTIFSFAYDFDPPEWFLEHPVPKEMMKHVNLMVSL
jgi:hypothetical protein